MQLAPLDVQSDDVIPVEEADPVESAPSFDIVVQRMVKEQFTSYVSAVRKFVRSLSDNVICGILLRPDTSLLNMCQIVVAGEYRIKDLARVAFNMKYAGRVDLTEQLNQWNPEQIKRFFEIFGALLVSLDVRSMSHCDLILRCVATHCAYLTELQCTVTNQAIVHEVHPFLAQLRELHISDGTNGIQWT